MIYLQTEFRKAIFRFLRNLKLVYFCQVLFCKKIKLFRLNHRYTIIAFIFLSNPYLHSISLITFFNLLRIPYHFKSLLISCIDIVVHIALISQLFLFIHHAFPKLLSILIHTTTILLIFGRHYVVLGKHGVPLIDGVFM